MQLSTTGLNQVLSELHSGGPSGRAPISSMNSPNALHERFASARAHHGSGYSCRVPSANLVSAVRAYNNATESMSSAFSEALKRSCIRASFPLNSRVKQQYSNDMPLGSLK